LGASTSIPRALHWTHWGPSDSRLNFLSVYNSKISPIEICSENTTVV
jgi:hypothetical protein